MCVAEDPSLRSRPVRRYAAGARSPGASPAQSAGHDEAGVTGGTYSQATPQGDRCNEFTTDKRILAALPHASGEFVYSLPIRCFGLACPARLPESAHHLPDAEVILGRSPQCRLG